MELSLLDTSPVLAEEKDTHALANTIALAKTADRLGFKRYWFSEHHELNGIASASPAVMIAAIGSQTTQIRLGAGAVLLPLHTPYRVAETYRQLATLYPGRIDLGIGRAQGAPAEVAIALTGNFLEKVRLHPERLDELLRYLNSTTMRPTPALLPEVWLLGTGKRSAQAAAERGLPFAFGAFMSKLSPQDAVQLYHSQKIQKGRTMITLSAMCIPLGWTEADLKLPPLSTEGFPVPIIGTPEEVATQLRQHVNAGRADELMLHLPSPVYEARDYTVRSLAHALL
ncbi:MsnO8 family LLM class oxidoreductase [Aureibacillus halotolerans]|uniref:Luciferase family oxidoreductase group 1 n=1 Tax=Aureibacillus halotolerans TaxID=1508390 RepID=A0A4R6TX97_9BACI|nr:MsnO8 family LLM class oxidoreductase [Aureibacillus halotolerans]TDQ37392.1 luciferase family oxidoreductase group 1 [Aureibacillus halotolerans]